MRIVFMVLIALFAVIALGLAGYLFWGGGPSGAAARAEEERLQQQLAIKSKEALPVSMDKKLMDTRVDIKKFYAEHVPAYWSQIAGELNKLETANGVAEQSIRYKAEDTGLPNLKRVEIETGVAGDYIKIAHFINALERNPMLFVINQISVSGQPAGTVQLQIKLDTFLKGAA